MIARAIAVSCALLAARAARADDDEPHVAPCRPTVTCTADLAAPGTLEIEVGDQLRRGGDQTSNATPFLVKLPLATWLELQLGGNGLVYASGATGSTYVDDLIAGAKLHLADQTHLRPSLAVTLAVGVPSSNAPSGAATDLYATAHASKDLGALHLDANAGLYTYDVSGQTAYQPFVAVAAGYPLSARVTATLEPHYFARAGSTAQRDAGAIAAVAFAVRPWCVVDAAIDLVATDPRALEALAGISLAPARLWGGH